MPEMGVFNDLMEILIICCGKDASDHPDTCGTSVFCTRYGVYAGDCAGLCRPSPRRLAEHSSDALSEFVRKKAYHKVIETAQFDVSGLSISPHCLAIAFFELYAPTAEAFDVLVHAIAFAPQTALSITGYGPFQPADEQIKNV